IDGTRTPVRAIVELWRGGLPLEEIPSHLPHLNMAQIFDALSYPETVVEPLIGRGTGLTMLTCVDFFASPSSESFPFCALSGRLKSVAKMATRTSAASADRKFWTFIDVSPFVRNLLFSSESCAARERFCNENCLIVLTMSSCAM